MKRSGTKNVEYVILCPFRRCRNALFFELRYYYVQEEIFLSFTSGFDSGRQFAEGGRGRNRGKLKENLHYLLLGLYLMEFDLIKVCSDVSLCR